jgi:TrmH family RNA methyltransferase
MEKITSRDNQKIKFAGRVRDGKADELLFIEGLRLAEEALRSNLNISEIFFTEDFAESERGKAFLKKAGEGNFYEASENVFNSISDTKHSQGVIVIASKPETGKSVVEAKLPNEAREFPLVVLLHQINNPSNLGAILRTCEAAGVSGVVLTKNSADVFSPKALRGAMGASFRLAIWNDADFFDALNWANEKDFVSVYADAGAEKSYAEIDWETPRLVIFGSEAHGLSKREKASVIEEMKIPMENDVESLNLAVSCGVILFEAKRRRIN